MTPAMVAGRVASWSRHLSRVALMVCGLALAHVQAEAATDRAPEVTIDPGGVPPAVLQAVTTSVNQIAALSQDQDGGEIERLRRRALDVTYTALATEGYFAPKVELQTGTDAFGETWDITIEPGERAMVRSVELQFEGAITGEAYAERRERLRAGWLLSQGKPFRNAEWESAKRDLLAGVTATDFALARMTASLARVDPDTASVELSVIVASGPRIILGPLETEGFDKVPPSLVSRYLRYTPGATPYDRRQLIAWQQELQRTVFFSAIDVSLDTREAVRDLTATEGAAATASPPAEVDPTAEPSTQVVRPQGRFARFMQQAEAVVPVRVAVTEARRHRLDLSLGIDSDVGPRAEAMYRQNVVAGRAVELQAGVGIDPDRQLAFTDIHLPPDPKGYRDKFGVLAEHQDIQGQRVQRTAAGWIRTQTRQGAGSSRVEYETRLGLLASYERVRYADVDYRLPSGVATYEWLRRDVDSKYNPRQGTLVSLGAGLGSALDGWAPFGRLQARGQVWWPIGQRDLFTVRGEVGKVWAGSSTNIPSDFGFRTGGARTIRGYRYLSLGQEVNGAVIGTNALAVASAEYQHYFTETLGIGVFVDAGDAAPTFRDMDIAVGVGAGLRIRTPAGPIFIDLAYAARDKRLRLDFSLGIAF